MTPDVSGNIKGRPADIHFMKIQKGGIAATKINMNTRTIYTAFEPVRSSIRSLSSGVGAVEGGGTGHRPWPDTIKVCSTLKRTWTQGKQLPNVHRHRQSEGRIEGRICSTGHAR